MRAFMKAEFLQGRHLRDVRLSLMRDSITIIQMQCLESRQFHQIPNSNSGHVKTAPENHGFQRGQLPQSTEIIITQRGLVSKFDLHNGKGSHWQESCGMNEPCFRKCLQGHLTIGRQHLFRSLGIGEWGSIENSLPFLMRHFIAYRLAASRSS